MMHELPRIQAELSDVVESLADVEKIFTLLLNLFPDELSEDWQIQAHWVTDELQGFLWTQYDLLQGLSRDLNRLQAEQSKGKAA